MSSSRPKIIKFGWDFNKVLSILRQANGNVQFFCGHPVHRFTVRWCEVWSSSCVVDVVTCSTPTCPSLPYCQATEQPHAGDRPARNLRLAARFFSCKFLAQSCKFFARNRTRSIWCIKNQMQVFCTSFLCACVCVTGIISAYYTWLAPWPVLLVVSARHCRMADVRRPAADRSRMAGVPVSGSFIYGVCLHACSPLGPLGCL